eukprot:CAMPEP_0172186262 /NCGR_PEP_ID=MMETSP1050-20130122/20657_1 /TAXON_ID=233186 /ORGANISM="Cryptomonas curvata, Strain CCAP979/52" /LENGTH=45 /DNA_ID= /DNA_START= /DNA_END= /DNA_ORIENTATION=
MCASSCDTLARSESFGQANGGAMLKLMVVLGGEIVIEHEETSSGC